MTIAGKNLPVQMIRANLDNTPEFALPAGFTLRCYQSGDETHWLRIHLAADRYNEITPELFRQQFGAIGLQAPSEQDQNVPSSSSSSSSSKPRTKSRTRTRTTTRTSQLGMNSALRELCRRQCYLLTPTSEIVGTATAWFDDAFQGGRWGRVHWMAIIPEFQGRGLAKALMTSVCRRLRELGHERAYLSTSTARHAAIGLYLRFGFEPLIRNEKEAAVWREVLPTVLRGV